MTLEEAMGGAYGWAVANAMSILLVALAWPVVGVIAALVGKGGKTDTDGRAIASVVVGGALAFGLFELVALVVAAGVLHTSVLVADVRLLLAPLVCVGGSLLGIRLVFPLSELGSVRTFLEVGAFAVVAALIFWMFGKFRGWGLYFVGSIGEGLALAALAIALLRRLYRRAFAASDG